MSYIRIVYNVCCLRGVLNNNNNNNNNKSTMHTQYWQQTVNLAHFSEMLKTPSVDIYKNKAKFQTDDLRWVLTL